MGLDPGIDHMSAVSKIKDIKAHGGVIDSFRSVCGALPDLSSNTNPIGYKLSWAPESLVGASLRDAKIKTNGEVIDLPGGTTYQHPSFEEIPGFAWFEVYANANSLPYIDYYGIPEVRTIFRGTLRYAGWCDMVTQMQRLGLFDETRQDMSGKTYASLMRKITGAPDGAPALESVAGFLNLPADALAVKKLEWLGLFDETPIPMSEGSPRDALSAIYGKKLLFTPGERDLIVMNHRFGASYPATGERKTISSTLIARGDVSGDTAIARTTGIPIGIAADLILSGAVAGDGVIIPVTEDIYVPALAELAREGIGFTEEEIKI
jgi:saccharopine dehydrogenase-like NADP-dependent oxidoreductase